MPIITTAQQPAQWTLEADGIFTIPAGDAARQDIRPLRLLLVDLMSATVGLQAQLVRLLANTALQIDLQVVHLGSAPPPQDGPTLAPRPFAAVAGERFDGLLVSHAAATAPALDAFPCWDELRDLLDWSLEHVHATLCLGWSALAALDHFYGIPALPTAQPRIGIQRHRVRRRQSYLLRGFDDAFDVPVGLLAEPDPQALAASPWLEVLADSAEGAPYVLRNRSRRQAFITGLPHYEPGHLVLDQLRLGAAAEGRRFTLPECTWRAHAQTLVTNWLNYYVYQASPYHLAQITPLALPEHLRQGLGAR